MSTPFHVNIDKIRSERNKDIASPQGFLYILHRSVNDKEHWVCEKRGICKARLQTMNDSIIKPANPSDIQSQHFHGTDIARIERLKGYRDLKIAARNSEVSIRNLLSISVVILLQKVLTNCKIRFCKENGKELQKHLRRKCR